MRLCPACRTQYADDQKVCPNDNMPLIEVSRTFAKLRAQGGPAATDKGEADEGGKTDKTPTDKTETKDKAAKDKAAKDPREATTAGGKGGKGGDTEPVSGVSPTAEALQQVGTVHAGMTIGEYEVERRIAEGGMGVIYAGVHPVISKRVAIKVLNKRFAQDPKAVSRFVLEARSVNQIGHHSIVDIFSIGELDDGRNYMVMELLDGLALHQLLPVVKRFDPGQIVPAYEQICDALSAAHKIGFVHRDLKPDNIIVLRRPPRPLIKILDFGIAKLRGSASGENTEVGTVLGTPEYMAPEQCRGLEVDARTDIYALGVMLYELVTGRKPFWHQSAIRVLTMQIQDEPPPPSRFAPIGEGLEKLILRSMSKDPKKRQQSAAEFYEELAKVEAPKPWSVAIELPEREIDTAPVPVPPAKPDAPTPSPVVPVPPPKPAVSVPAPVSITLGGSDIDDEGATQIDGEVVVPRASASPRVSSASEPAKKPSLPPPGEVSVPLPVQITPEPGELKSAMAHAALRNRAQDDIKTIPPEAGLLLEVGTSPARPSAMAGDSLPGQKGALPGGVAKKPTKSKWGELKTVPRPAVKEEPRTHLGLGPLSAKSPPPAPAPAAAAPGFDPDAEEGPTNVVKKGDDLRLAKLAPRIDTGEPPTLRDLPRDDVERAIEERFKPTLPPDGVTASDVAAAESGGAVDTDATLPIDAAVAREAVERVDAAVVKDSPPAKPAAAKAAPADDAEKRDPSQPGASLRLVVDGPDEDLGAKQITLAPGTIPLTPVSDDEPREGRRPRGDPSSRGQDASDPGTTRMPTATTSARRAPPKSRGGIWLWLGLLLLSVAGGVVAVLLLRG